jgi:carbon storage regulator
MFYVPLWRPFEADPSRNGPKGGRDRRRGPTHGGTTMLVLSRKLGEVIVIPGIDLELTVVGIEGNAVRLGITAPPEVRVYREELWNRVVADTGAPPSRKVAR